MITVDDYILGNGALHDRFRITTEILGALVSSAPRPVSIAQLESYTGRPAKELVKLCGALWRAMLMRPEAKSRKLWALNCEPSSVTLEDVFRCVIATQPSRAKTVEAPPPPVNTDRNHHDVDLLVMQATMAINQSVFMHLRQFSLDRLKISAAAKPPERKHYQRGASHANLRDNVHDNVHDFEVNSWLIEL
jgi:DNA-binding IscR family transcriptional regulator